MARVNYGKLNELELKSGSVNSQVAWMSLASGWEENILKKIY